MAFLSLDEHRERLAAAGVRSQPRWGAGTAKDPFREADGSPPVRSAARERAELEAYVATWSESYRLEIAALAAQCRPMADDCRAVVLLPARNERQTLTQTLTFLLDQRATADGSPLPVDVYEVQLLLNRFPDENAADQSGDLPATERLTVVDYVHAAEEHAPLTRARKVSADVAVHRALARTRYTSPLYFISQDADMLWVDPREVAWYIDRFDAQPGLDALRGQQDRCPWIMVQHPLVLVMRRSWNFSETLLTARDQHPDRNPGFDFTWSRTITSGWSSGFTAEAYAQIRGYTPDRRFGEDMDIGERISCMRGAEVTGRGFVPQTQTIGRCPLRSEGSPRRWLYWAVTNVQPYTDERDYANFFDLHIERDVKDASLAELHVMAEKVTGLHAEPVTEALRNDLEFLSETLRSPEKARSWFGRVLPLLGFRPGDVRLDTQGLRVVNLDNVSDAIAVQNERIDNLRPPYAYPAGPWDPARRGATWRSFAVPADAR